MIKKSKNVFIIVILLIFFIFSNYTKVYASINTNDMKIYAKGDKFKIVKDTCKYNVEKKLFSVKVEKGDDEKYFTKGEIVTYTGNYEKKGSVYYLEVEKNRGNKKGYVDASSIEGYNLQNLKLYASLKAFVEENGLESMAGSDIAKKQREALEKISDKTQRDTISVKVSDILRTIDGEKISNEEKMNRLNEEFIINQGDAYGDPAKSDLYYGYMLGSKWISYKTTNEEIKENTENGKSIAEQFDEKYEEYKKANVTDINTLIEYQTALQTLYDQLGKDEKTEERTEKLNEVQEAVIDKDSSALETSGEIEEEKKESTVIYQYPDKQKGNTAGGLDDMIGDADKFIDSADDAAISTSSLQEFSKTFYNIFLTIGIIVATLVGSILGIKFMLGGAEEKAHIKELLVPYIVGCVVIFGAFAIWKIVVTILSNSLA